MKICQIMLAKGFGGAERIFVDYCIGLKERGHDVLAIIDTKSDSKKELEKHNIPFKEINIFFRKNIFAQRKAANIIADFNPDIVHAHLRRAMDFIAPSKKKIKSPLVASIHNYNSIKTYSSADHLIALTNEQKDFIISQDNKLEEKTTVIQNFSRIPPAKVNIENKSQLRLLSYGRFVHKKGFDLLLKSFKKLSDINKEVSLTLVGDGPQKQELQALFKSLDLQEKAEIRPWSSSIKELLDEHDIFILPSRIEPFGIVLLEAMARGKLIVSTKSEGPRQFLREQTSLLCEVEDEEDLFTKMYEAANNFNSLKERAINANKEYKEKFYIDAVIPKVEFLYEKVAIK